MNTCQTNILFKAFLDSFIRTSQKPPYLDHLLLQSLAANPFSPLNFPGNLLKMNELLKSRSFAAPAETKPTDQQTSTVSKTPAEKPSSTEDPPKRIAPQKETFLLTRPPEVKIEEQSSIKIEEQAPLERPHRTDPKPQPKQHQPSLSKSEALDYIQNILAFLVKNVGRVRGTKLKVEGEKLHENIDSIKEIYDGLMNKFMISNKTKEEKIKYVLRKSFKFMKEGLMIKNGMSLETENDAAVKKQIENMFFEHYFSEKDQEALSSKDYANIKDIIMPFRLKIIQILGVWGFFRKIRLIFQLIFEAVFFTANSLYTNPCVYNFFNGF